MSRIALRIAAVLALAAVAPTSANEDPIAAALAVDDSCMGEDATCSLELRQLRAQETRAEVAQHEVKDTIVKSTESLHNAEADADTDKGEFGPATSCGPRSQCKRNDACQKLGNNGGKPITGTLACKDCAGDMKCQVWPGMGSAMTCGCTARPNLAQLSAAAKEVKEVATKEVKANATQEVKGLAAQGSVCAKTWEPCRIHANCCSSRCRSRRCRDPIGGGAGNFVEVASTLLVEQDDPTPAGACTDADAAIMMTLGSGHGDGSFPAVVAGCGKGAYSFWSGFKQNSLAQCVQSKTGLSAGCASCFGSAGQYGYNNCKVQCLFGSWCGDSCLSCTSSNTAAVATCAGPITLPTATQC